MNRIIEFYNRLREWANDYEPAVARTLAAAVFQLLAALGIAVGDLPEKVDAVLAFVAIFATVLAGKAIRKRVKSKATQRREAEQRERVERHRGNRPNQRGRQ